MRRRTELPVAMLCYYYYPVPIQFHPYSLLHLSFYPYPSLPLPLSTLKLGNR
jgi:hypothetical protein